jgi:hypothetical protein
MRVQVFGVTVAMLLSAVPISHAQAPAKGATGPAPKIEGTLIEVMRGILFPSSNIIFDAQANDPATKKPPESTDPFAALYGGWLQVENASIAIAESANLLSIPGRMCSNGKPAPMNAADWPGYVEGLRVAARQSYKAAKAKSQDQILDAAGALTDACAACHMVYRDTPSLAARCTPK